MERLNLTLFFDSEMSRRTCLRALAAGVAALSPLAVSTPAGAQRLGRINMGYMKIADLSPMFIGLDKGYFKEVGVDLNLTSMVGGAAIAPALASGSLNIGWSNTTSITIGVSKGFDFKFVCNGALNARGGNDAFGFVVHKDSGISSARDLAGKTVASNTLNNLPHLSGLFWIDHNGGDSSRVKWVEVPIPQMEAALANKKIDGFVTTEPFITVATSPGHPGKLMGHPLSEMAPRVLIASYFSSDAWIEKNADKVKAFIAAISKGITYHNEHKEEAKAVIAKWSGLRPELVGQMKMPAFEVAMKESDIQVQADLALKYRMIERRVAAKELISRHAPMA
ncbi:MAG: ABC transporter substrate-binding protein [Deltaproteobacteria bacterium]|nr:ABC transporter substrate-binding protein [Deltaproteobacteria bacterium]